jgi:geranylgeranyl diphosphate synthase, type I
MDLEWACATYLPWIEATMRELVFRDDEQVSGHFGMMQYHLGWRDECLGPSAIPGGKRIRPLMCLVACGAAGGDPRLALPAAAGLELLHNFSLIHDDIEDNSPTRRHRPTVWKLFGMPQACNVGDGMFGLAHLAFYRLRDRGVADRIVLEALRLFDETCLSLTEGQYLDMDFEKRAEVSANEYFRMIAAKTGALLATSPQLGALVAGAAPEQVEMYRAYGSAMGRAFQLQDDVLGIWGDESVTGKSTASDILSKKKSLPVIYALSYPATGQRLANLYAKSPVTEAEVPEVLALLDESEARQYVEAQIHTSVLHAYATLGLLQSQADPAFLAVLAELLDSLLGRVS